MTNDTKFISKLTKKFKINKKKSNWRTLNSTENLNTADEYMLYSDTEAELYQAKMNIQANRSFTYHNSSFNNPANEPNYGNTNNILAGLNANNNNPFPGRSKTAYARPSTNNIAYNTHTPITLNNNSNTNGTTNITSNINQSSSNSNRIYPNNEGRKNSFQTIFSPETTTQPIPIQLTSSSTNSTPYTSAPNSPLSFDSSDTYVNDLKANLNMNVINNSNNNYTTTSNTNPFLSPNVNSNKNITVNTANMDPALSHTLISPIEFDGSGKEIKSSPKITVTFTPETKKAESNSKQSEKKEPSRSKSIKNIKPLITFDTPPVVSPITPDPDSDSDSYRGRRRGKKNKKYSKRRSSSHLKTSELKSSYTYGSSRGVPSDLNNPRVSSSSSEEDDDVPLGIIQYKCLSSLLKDSAPPNISSLQSNTKSSKKSHKDVYGYMSPNENQERYDFPRYTNYSNYYHANYVI